MLLLRRSGAVHRLPELHLRSELLLAPKKAIEAGRPAVGSPRSQAPEQSCSRSTIQNECRGRLRVVGNGNRQDEMIRRGRAGIGGLMFVRRLVGAYGSAMSRTVHAGPRERSVAGDAQGTGDAACRAVIIDGCSGVAHDHRNVIASPGAIGYALRNTIGTR